MSGVIFNWTNLLESEMARFAPSIYFFFISHYILLFNQVDRVAIVSPLGPTLANSFLCHYEKEWNKQYKCLKLTFEAENENSLSFLDIKITRNNQQFKTSVYRKPTFSGVITHYESYLDQIYKISLNYTLLFPCFSIYFDYTLFHLGVENLREILKKNICPSGIIEQSTKSFLNKLHVPKKSNSNCS